MKALYFTILLGLPLFAWSQLTDRLVVKLDASAPLHRSLGGSVEWSLDARTSIEVKASFERYPRDESSIFAGNWIRHYTERRVDSFYVYVLKEMANAPDVYYLGDNRPLPASLGVYVPLETSSYAFGYRFNYGKRWQWFLQPGLGLARHHYMTVQDRVSLENDQYKQWEIPLQHLLITQRTVDMRQERIMRERVKWYGGIYYDMGIKRSLGKRFSVELRAAGGVQFFTPYRIQAPRAVKEATWQYHLMVGYRIW